MRIVLHTAGITKQVTVTGAENDVLVLQTQESPWSENTKQYLMKIDSRVSRNIKTICGFLEVLFFKVYQHFIVLLAGTQTPICLVLVRLSRLR